MTDLPSTGQHRIPRIDHGPRGGVTKGVVIHVMEGTLEGTLSWWAKDGHEADGAHLCVGLRSVVQTADLDTLCWHAPGNDVARKGIDSGNHEFVGFEHEGMADQSTLKWLSHLTQLRLSANRCAWVLYHYGCGAPQWGFNVVPHYDFPAGRHNCPGKNFPAKPYMALVRLAYGNLQRSRGAHW